jgi:hypothetical protein
MYRIVVTVVVIINKNVAQVIGESVLFAPESFQHTELLEKIPHALDHGIGALGLLQPKEVKREIVGDLSDVSQFNRVRAQKILRDIILWDSLVLSVFVFNLVICLAQEKSKM